MIARIEPVVLTAVIAVGVAAAAAAHPGRLHPLVLGLAGAGVAVGLLGAVARWASLGIVAAALLGAAFAATRYNAPRVVDGRSIVIAVALLLLAEAVAWAAEGGAGGVPGLPARRRLVALALASTAGAAGAALVTVLVTLPVTEDLAVAALGGGGLALVAAVVLSLARTRNRAAGDAARGGPNGVAPRSG